MRTVVVVDLIKGGGPSWPRIESDDFLMSTGSTRPLEDAYRVSQHDLVTWAPSSPAGTPSTPTSWSARPGSRLRAMSWTPTTRWWPSCAKRYLGADAVAGDGVHGRLRETAAAYLSPR